MSKDEQVSARQYGIEQRNHFKENAIHNKFNGCNFEKRLFTVACKC
jgi:hypothetical protein